MRIAPVARVKRITFNETTLVQLVNFCVFLAGLFMTCNLSFDIMHRMAALRNFEENLYVWDSVLVLLAALTVMVLSITTPYDIHQHWDGEDFKTILYQAGLFMASTGRPLEDPSILFSTTFEAANAVAEALREEIDNRGSVANNGFDMLTETINVTEVREHIIIDGLGIWFLQLVAMSKGVLFAAALVFTLRVVDDARAHRRMTRRTFQRSLLGRATAVASLAVGAYAWGNAYMREEAFPQNAFTRSMNDLLDEYRGGIDSIETWLLDPSTEQVFEYTAGAILLILAGAMIVLYQHYEYAGVCIAAVSVKTIVRMDRQGRHDDLPTSAVAHAGISWVYLIGYVIRWLWRDGDRFANLLPNILYKLGNILNLVSMMFALVAYLYPWMTFEFKAAGVAEEAIGFVENVQETIDDVTDNVLKVARAINPCAGGESDVRKKFDSDNQLPGGLDDINAQMRQWGEGIYIGKDEGRRQCIDNNNQFSVITSGSVGQRSECVEVKYDYDLTRERFENRSKGTSAVSSSGTSYDTEAEDNEYYVDEACVDGICYATIALTVLGFGIAQVPFLGPAGTAVSKISSAAYSVYKVGKKIARYLPRLRRKKKTYQRLAKLLGFFAMKTTSHGLRFTAALAILFLPLILGAGGSITLLMFRRDVFERDEFTVNRKLTIGLKLAVGLFFPLMFINLVFCAIMWAVPAVMDEILRRLPEALVAANLEQGTGLIALRMAYTVAALANAMMLVSAVLFLFESSLLSALRYARSSLNTFYSRVRRKLRRSRERQAAKLREALEAIENGDDEEEDGEEGGGEYGKNWDDVGTSAQFVIRHRRWGKHRERYAGRFMLMLKRTIAFVIIRAGSWNGIYLQPLIMSFPVLIIAGREVIQHKNVYVTTTFGLTRKVRDTMEAIAEIVANEDRSEAMGDEMSGNFCDMVGVIVMEAMKALSLGPELVMRELLNLAANLKGALGAAKEFVDAMGKLISLGFIPINLRDLQFISVSVGNFAIFGIPIFCTLILAGVWVMSFVWDDLGRVRKIGSGATKRLTGSTEGDDEDEEGGTLEYSIAGAVASSVLFASVANITGHMAVGKMFEIVASYEIPLINFEAALGANHYQTQLCSVFNIMSVMALYVNMLVPMIGGNT